MKKIIPILLILTMLVTAVPVMAKTPRNGRYTDKQGYTYIYKRGKLQTGWIRYHGKHYYAHRTSGQFPKGSVVKHGYRYDERKDRLYYFDSTGNQVRHNTRYLTLNKNKSIRYIYTPGNRGMRYNVRHKRYQVKRNGKWKDVGMQCLPEIVDTQE